MAGEERHLVLVSIHEPFRGEVSEAWVEEVVRAALQYEGVPAAEVDVLITDDETVRELNRRYAGEDEATDVLSFSLREGEEFPPPPDALPRLGEVILSLPTARRQAAEHGRTLRREVAHLLIHGTLHLLGYDHAEPEEEREMRSREETLLAGVNST